MTRCGVAFLGVWALAMVMRVAFVWAVTDVDPFRTWVGQQMASLNLTPAVIAPFFVIWALVMVGGRVAALIVLSPRARALQAA